ncbi:MAG: class I SAM-dependent methyltransferase [Eubacteriales bacterium]|nr:class I SAM-dependent methyltransferase [Eubacteriales bacterium]
MDTLEYYNQNAVSFSQNTRDVDFHEIQQRFLAKLPGTGHILDFGCGSGRDTRFFLEQGYMVDAVDGSAELCRIASRYTGIPVKQMLFQELNEMDAYAGIWACASILHIPKQELLDVVLRIRDALKEGGVFYTSFKYGDFEGMRNGRYFSDFTEESFRIFMQSVPELVLEAQWITGDARPGREEEKWLNVIYKKIQKSECNL